MTTLHAADRLALAASRPDGEIDLVEGALAIAAALQPGLDVDAERARLAELGAAAAERLDGAAAAGEARSGSGESGGGRAGESEAGEGEPGGGEAGEGRCGDGERLRRLTAFLYGEHGFAGDRDSYDHPDNSLLNRVLDRKRGIPLSLALVLIETGRQAGVPLVGVGFPGHFLVRHACHCDIVLDPFAGGRPLTRAECQGLLARVTGGGVDFHPRLLAPAPHLDVLLRLLNNLQAAYLKRGEVEPALTTLDLALRLIPGDPVRLRARGMLRLRGCDFAGAAEDLESYLAACPEAPDRGAVGELIDCARKRLLRLH